ncbi:hypothetical protein [Noviherbaspirillum pedocola]|uniref:Uncharacterized protein n=1 Tax=Noviherbaspirillum pedocola TaxID=2801341 RepID=A0A934W1S0_9BURK|nr:hypothetical protein [Noviherbaspirillum pedocola]MBK4735506.1 hypothetical protein [Noviherbaspirillum pedocola]
MKKHFGIATLFLVWITGAQAQEIGAGLAGHPDARNHRQMHPASWSDRHGPKAS